MKREEAISIMNVVVHMLEPQYDTDRIEDAVDIAIEALEQEPCEDAISRKMAQAKIKNICNEYRLSYEDGERKASTGGSAYALGHAFDDLPPVTPQPKMGHWIEHKHNGMEYIECSECSVWFLQHYLLRNSYCPNCGADMRGKKMSDSTSRQAIIAGSYLLEDEKYHTCGRCKHGNTPYCSYPCSECVHGVDNRKDYWELAESEECKNDEKRRK